MKEAVVAEELRKKYITKKRKGLLKAEEEVIDALKGVSFKVKHGEVVGLLGPNGAGKTTTVKMISTLLLPDSGTAYVEGHDVVREAREVRKYIGIMLSVEKGFYGKLTGKENLRYFGALYGLGGEELDKRIKYLMDLLELSKLGAEDRLFEEYSLGMKARLALARALLKDPPVLLLDEPTLGLDPPSARKIRGLVKDLARKEGKAILYTTHNMFEAELLCDRILLINKGKIVAEGTPEDLKRRLPSVRVVTVVIKGDESIVKNLADTMRGINGAEPSIKQVEFGAYEVSVKTRKPEAIINEIAKLTVGSGAEILRVRIEEPTLEDVFIYFTDAVKE